MEFQQITVEQYEEAFKIINTLERREILGQDDVDAIMWFFMELKSAYLIDAVSCFNQLETHPRDKAWEAYKTVMLSN